MFVRTSRLLPLFVLGALAACSSDGTGPTSGLNVGQSLKLAGAQDVKLDGGANGAQYFVVLANNSTDPASSQSYSLVGNGLGGSVAVLVPQDQSSLSLSPFGSASGTARLDASFEARLRARERAVLTPRIPAAR